MLHCSQTPVKDALRRGGRRGEVEKGVTGLCSCFASLLGDAVCWLGLQRERAEQRRGEGRRGEERGGEGRRGEGRRGEERRGEERGGEERRGEERRGEDGSDSPDGTSSPSSPPSQSCSHQPAKIR